MREVTYAQGLQVNWTEEEFCRIKDIKSKRKAFNDYLDEAESHKTIEWYVKLYERGLSARQIGWLYGRSLWKVKRALQDSGVKIRKPCIDTTLLTVAERATLEGRIGRAMFKEGKL